MISFLYHISLFVVSVGHRSLVVCS